MDENDESHLLWLQWIGAGLLVGGVASLSYRRNGYATELSTTLTGKSIIITGANSGIGQATALECARQGADVVLACRDMKKCEATRQLLLKQIKVPSQSIKALHLDLLDLKSIKQFATQIHKCNVLVNNAGAVSSVYKQVGRGIDRKTNPVFRSHSNSNQPAIEESVFGNHIGSFYLTQLLLPILQRTSHETKTDSKIIFVSSRLEKYVPAIDDNSHSHNDTTNASTIKLHDQFTSSSDSFDPMSAYSLSKHLSLLASYQLANYLALSSSTTSNTNTDTIIPDQFTDMHKKYPEGVIAVNNVSPGVVNTRLSRYLPSWLQYVSFPVRSLFLRTPEQGADSIVWAICAKEVQGKSGKYFFDRKEIQSSSQSYDPHLRKKVYDETLKLIDQEVSSGSSS